MNTEHEMMVEGFSKLSREEKIELVSKLVLDATGLKHDFLSHLHSDIEYRKLYDELSENTVSNYFLPYSLAPNFLINNKIHLVPMVTEESSVVAAASAAAKYWAQRGGFKSKVISVVKSGHVHFIWNGDFRKLQEMFTRNKIRMINASEQITGNMRKRGGGILDIELADKREMIPGYFQLHLKFNTLNAMGANFINSVLEKTSDELKRIVMNYNDFTVEERKIEIVMSVLSNYSPDCIAECYVECPVSKLSSGTGSITAEQFARKFKLAVDIAYHDLNRAVTHNKGIFNGIDATAIATGNDFRAIEAQGHAWAARSGKYRGLSEAFIHDGMFRLQLTVPLTPGTVGGVTGIHPLAKRSLEILGNPGVEELMQIMASVGLATNFSAIRSLITKGIQAGHMRMHLTNILQSFHASMSEKMSALSFFRDNTVTYSAVEKYLRDLRNNE